MPSYLLEITDPRKRLVKLDADVFAFHIASKHTLIQVHHIQKAVEAPDFIVQDAIFSERENYYAMGIVDKWPELIVKVCVENRGAYGTVVTAFTTSAPKSTEVVIWPLVDNEQ